MTGAIFTLALRQAAAPRRAIFLVLLALLPLGLAVIIRGLGNPGGGDLIAGVLEALVIHVVLPLVVIVLATSAFGNEVEDRTLSLLTTKPVPRWSIVLAKLTATIIVAAPLMIAVSAVVTMMDPDGSGKAAVAAAAGTLVGRRHLCVGLHVGRAADDTSAGIRPHLRAAVGGDYHQLPGGSAVPQHPQLHSGHNARPGRDDL